MIQIKSWLTTATLSVLCFLPSMAQTAEDEVYVTKDNFADATYFLHDYPDSASLEFNDDLIQLQWGKTMRNTPRGKQASEESLWEPAIMHTVMQQVLELDTISDETTPALARLIKKAYNTGNNSTKAVKEVLMRKRPFVQVNDDLWAKYDDDFLRTNGSYPSGHTAFGWATALIFAEMWPELQDTILRRGIQFGENRVITGAHYQSDVTAGYLCAAAAVAQAHNNPELQKDIITARAEYAQLKGLPADYDPTAAATIPHGENILNNPVDTASYRYITDLTRHWNAKSLRDTPRGQQAEIEAEYSAEMMYKVFGEAMGISLSEATTPAICELVKAVLDKSSETADWLKPLRFRKRPFVQLGEPTTVPGDEEKERGKSSFPSGHTHLGWSEALIMAEVAPDCQNEILRRGYEYGYNRLIAGYHWFTDIEATRQLATSLVARLHADKSFQELLQKAKEEYKKVAVSIESLPIQQPESAPAVIFTIDGRSVSQPPFNSIFIENGTKKILSR